MKMRLGMFIISIFGMLAKVPSSHYSGTWLEIARRPMWI
jgi:lipocalin